MLQAKTKDGQLITLSKLTKSEIRKVKHSEFFCPICQEPVLVKAGEKMIAHFAHRSKLECISSDYGEGAYHEQGKLLLYNWLQNQRVQVELEKFLPDINQRPDIFITINRRKIVFEYQCARVSGNVINERSAGFLKSGITPIWILGANHFHRLSQHHFKIDTYILTFIHRFSSSYPLTLYFFCPHSLQFITVQHIQITSPRSAIGTFSIRPLKNITFANLFFKHPLNKPVLLERWKYEKKKFRLKQNKRLYGEERTWHRWLYVNGTHKELLPSIVYLPVSSQYVMKTPLWNWQSRLCLELLLPLPVGDTFTYARCTTILQYRPQEKYYLIKELDCPIYEYLSTLVLLHFLEEVTPLTFRKVNDILFHPNIEVSLAEDARLMNRLIQYSTMK